MDADRELRRAEVVARFAALVGAGDAALPLDEAVLHIAACHHPKLDMVGALAQLDDLAAGCPSPTVDGVVRHLFGDLGFTGNSTDYDDPANSFLDEVVARRTGLPISLSVLTVEVARRIGVELVGVGLPGHFVVGLRHDPGTFIDPFDGGTVLDIAGVKRLLAARSGGAVRLDPAWLAPVGPTAILVRMLTNLKVVYARRGQLTDLRWVMQLRAAVPGLGVEESAEFARLMAPTN